MPYYRIQRMSIVAELAVIESAGESVVQAIIEGDHYAIFTAVAPAPALIGEVPSWE